ncbi:MAG: glycosyltransferase [Planctomycetes bacterium]|nr:glycosyltransferase [Planctomycetota bacterium]
MSSTVGAPRVLHVITTLDRGGAEKALLELCRARAAASGPQRIGVAYLKGDGELTPEFESLGIEVRDLEVRGVRAARAQSAFQSFRRAFAPDVVHSHLFKADVLAASCLGRSRPDRDALVSSKHNVDVYLERAPWRMLGRAALARADACIAVSEGVAAFLRSALGEPQCGIDVVRYGVEAPAAPIVAAPGTGRVLCVGRLEPQKDPLGLIEAFRRVREERPATLTFLGRGSMDAQVRRAAAALPAGSVEFAGFAADPVPHFDAADMVVLASRWEGLGLALVEAAQRGRPVVATCVGGVPEVVEDGVTGLLVPPGDAKALAEAILRVLDDPEFARRMGAAARARALGRFSVERCLAQHEAVYARALGMRA